MQVTAEKIHKSTDRAGIYLLKDSFLACPFHAYQPSEYGQALQLYKVYLYQTLELGKDPQQVARKLSRENGLLMSFRWHPCSVQELRTEIEKIVERNEIVIGLFRDIDPGLGLANYLEWKLNQMEKIAA